MFRQFREIQKGEFFLIAGDCSMGAGDRSVCQFFSKNRLDVPIVYSTKSTATDMTDKCHPVFERLFDITGIKPLVAYERNNGGAFEMDRLGKLNRNHKYSLFLMPRGEGSLERMDEEKYGWDTNTATRSKMLEELKDAVDGRVIKIYDELTIEEMYSFITVRTNTLWKAQADKSAHDDHVMSLAIAWQMYQYSPSIRKVTERALRPASQRQFPSTMNRMRELRRRYERR